jgi:hypothetical protein
LKPAITNAGCKVRDEVGVDTIINAAQSHMDDWGILAIVEADAVEEVT